MHAVLLEQIIGIIAEQLDISIDDITVDSIITDNLRADSLDIVELVNTFEKQYNITATDEDIMGLSTVESVYDFIAEKLGYKTVGSFADGQISW